MPSSLPWRTVKVMRGGRYFTPLLARPPLPTYHHLAGRTYHTSGHLQRPYTLLTTMRVVPRRLKHCRRRREQWLRQTGYVSNISSSRPITARALVRAGRSISGKGVHFPTLAQALPVTPRAWVQVSMWWREYWLKRKLGAPRVWAQAGR